MNLISNSLKFTLEGKIELIIEDDGEYMIFKVADTGVGIKQQDQPKLFKLFGTMDYK
jgi:signal transduction histidine kinase